MVNGLRTIKEFKGEKDSSPFLDRGHNHTCQVPASVFLEVQQCLDARVRDVRETDTNLARFIPFLHVDPSVIQSTYRDVVIDQRHYRVWRFKEDLMIASSDRQPSATLSAKNTQWYRFDRG